MISQYHAYLLRIWNHIETDHERWLISLEDPKSHDMFYFKTVEELLFFFNKITHSDLQDRLNHETLENEAE
jgi:hypothetical protein